MLRLECTINNRADGGWDWEAVIAQMVGLRAQPIGRFVPTKNGYSTVNTVRNAIERVAALLGAEVGSIRLFEREYNADGRPIRIITGKELEIRRKRYEHLRHSE